MNKNKNSTNLLQKTIFANFLNYVAFISEMAVITKDAKIPDDAPKDILLGQHAEFLAKYSDDKDDYEYVMSEFLRINGVYWSLTAMDLIGNIEKLDREEVRV